jgi:hypothetical protein
MSRDIVYWSHSGHYSSASAYGALFIGQTTMLDVKELWKVRAPNSCRLFVWLVLYDRCWTSDRLQRHGLQNNDPCTLCDQSVETLDTPLGSMCVQQRDLVQNPLSSGLTAVKPDSKRCHGGLVVALP